MKQVFASHDMGNTGSITFEDVTKVMATAKSVQSNSKPVMLDFARSRMSHPPMPAGKAEIDGVKVRLMFDSGAAINDALLANQPYHAAIRQLAGDPNAKSYPAKTVNVAGEKIATRIQCLIRPSEGSVIGSVFFSKHVLTVDLQAGTLLV